jgi:DNA polymerase
MPILHRDIESRSTLDLQKVGAWRYAGDASTDVWCIAYAVDDGPVQTWLPGQPIPEEFQIAARDSVWLVIAHNDFFEASIEERLLGPRYGWPLIPIERHRDTMAMALAAALPAKLETAAAALSLPMRKDVDGAKVMREMSRPRKARPGEDPDGIYWHDDPEKLRRLIAYNVRDVEVERELHRRLPALSDSEQALWLLDAEINRRGFRVDVALARAARTLVRERHMAIKRELSELTGGRITTIGQVAKIGDFLKEHGHKIAGVGKRNLAAVLVHKPDAEVTRLIKLRQEGGKASATKVDALLAQANDDRIHGALRFHGAATGRWTGHGFQPHNLSRAVPADPGAAIAAVQSGDLARVATIGPPLEVIGSLSRAMICAAPGKILIGADYSSIEPRVLCWLAGETWKLDAFRKFDATGDLAFENYCLVASRVLGRTVTPADEEGRQIGKFMELAFGFGGALKAFRRIAPDADFTDAQVVAFNRQWRAAHPRIVKFWGNLHRMVLHAVRKPTAPATFKNLSAEMRAGNLYLRLPSGREIAYPEARIGVGRYDSDEIIFKDNTKGQWRDTRGWHGTFAENVVQGIARDLLAIAMQRLESAGYPIVLHVHDECVAEVPEDFGSPEDFARIMVELPPWAEGLPLVAKPSRRKRYAKEQNGTVEDVEEDGEPSEELHDGIEVSDTDPGSGGPEITHPEPSLSVEPEADHCSTVENSENSGEPTEAGADTIVVISPAVAAAIAAMAAAMPRGTITEHSAADNTSDGAASDENEADEDEAGQSSAPPPKTDPELGPYIYQNACGGPHAKVVRTPNGKSRFSQQHWTGTAWQSGMAKHKLPYRLPELLAADPSAWVCITEGEKDCVNVAKLGFVATTNPNGADGWKSAKLVPYFAHLRRIAILEDNDAAGRERTKRIIKTLRIHDPLPDIRVVSFRELPDGNDVSDWLAQDRSRGRAELLARIEAITAGGELDEWDAGDLLGQGLPPPRQWIYGKQLCRRFASSLVAPGDIGKTTMRLTQAIELAIGRELLGHRIYRRCRVLVLSLEDDRDELWRRLRAICDCHHIDYAELKGWLFCAHLNGAKLAEAVDGERLLGELEPMLRKAIERRRPDLVILDPFVKLHALDENSNPDMDFVCTQLVKLAQEFNIAIDSPAHTRKGALTAGDSDNRRGASAQRDAGRLDYTLTAMDEDEAKRFGIDLDERKSYVRLDRAKANRGPQCTTIRHLTRKRRWQRSSITYCATPATSMLSSVPCCGARQTARPTATAISSSRPVTPTRNSAVTG